MVIDWVAVVEGGIPILGGLYATGLGWGLIRPGPSTRMQRFLPHFKWMGPALILFGLYSGLQTHMNFSHPPAEVIVKSIAPQLVLPTKVDEITTLDAIEGKADVITYRFTVTAPLKDMGGRESAEIQLKNQILGNACSNPGYQKLLQGGYTVEMRYSFQGAPEDILISVPPKFCGF
jgi:hypothetical protein